MAKRRFFFTRQKHTHRSGWERKKKKKEKGLFFTMDNNTAGSADYSDDVTSTTPDENLAPAKKDVSRRNPSTHHHLLPAKTANRMLLVKVELTDYDSESCYSSKVLKMISTFVETVPADTDLEDPIVKDGYMEKAIAMWERVTGEKFDEPFFERHFYTGGLDREKAKSLMCVSYHEDLCWISVEVFGHYANDLDSNCE